MRIVIAMAMWIVARRMFWIVTDAVTFSFNTTIRSSILVEVIVENGGVKDLAEAPASSRACQETVSAYLQRWAARVLAGVLHLHVVSSSRSQASRQQGQCLLLVAVAVGDRMVGIALEHGQRRHAMGVLPHVIGL